MAVKIKKSPQKDTQFNLTFTYSRETKGTYVFTEEGDDPVVVTLYMKKSKIGDIAPDALQVTITTSISE